MRGLLALCFVATLIISCDGIVLPGASLTGYSYCPKVGAVLQRTHDHRLFNFTDGHDICRVHNGILLSANAYESGCTSTLLGDTRIAWINQFEDGKTDEIAFATGTLAHPVSTRFVNASIYVTCEIPCQRTDGDRISNISENGTVTCERGYEYLHAQPVCSNATTQIHTCTIVKCNVSEIAGGIANRMVIQFQEAVTYSCLNNLALVGDAVQSCLENGSLSSVGPSCNSCKASAADFTTGLGGYTQATSSDQFDWTRNQGGTSSGETGPLSDHSSGSGHY
eukprot:scpid92734/ scgid5306/ 